MQRTESSNHQKKSDISIILKVVQNNTFTINISFI